MPLYCYCFATNEVCATIMLLCSYCFAVGVAFAIMLLLLVKYVLLLCCYYNVVAVVLLLLVRYMLLTCCATIVGQVCVVSVLFYYWSIMCCCCDVATMLLFFKYMLLSCYYCCAATVVLLLLYCWSSMRLLCCYHFASKALKHPNHGSPLSPYSIGFFFKLVVWVQNFHGFSSCSLSPPCNRVCSHCLMCVGIRNVITQGMMKHAT